MKKVSTTFSRAGYHVSLVNLGVGVCYGRTLGVGETVSSFVCLYAVNLLGWFEVLVEWAGKEDGRNRFLGICHRVSRTSEDHHLSSSVGCGNSD